MFFSRDIGLHMSVSTYPGTGETVPVEYPPPNQCPGKKEKRVRDVVLQQRPRLLYVVHPVSVLEQGIKSYSSSSGDIACQIPSTKSEWRHCLSNTLHQINVLEKRTREKELLFFSRDIVFRMSSTQSVSWNRGVIASVADPDPGPF